MKFNGTKTRVLTIALAVIYTLAPLSQTMAAGRSYSNTTHRRRATNPSTSKVRRRTKPGLSDGEKVVVP